LSALKPGAEVKRFKACHVRARRVDCVAGAVQEVEGLKRVAAVLRGSGLVQVDEGGRTLGMHQLLQQAVGSLLGWRGQCQRMRQLLHARCGRFGDEVEFDVGLFGVMREVAAAAVDAVGRVKEEGKETGDAWCSGMLLRLYEVAREVYGAQTEFPNRVLAAAHGSLVADLVREEAMREGGASAGRRVTLRELVRAAPHVRDVVARDPEFKANEDDHRVVEEEMLKGVTREAALDTVTVRRFDLGKCLGSQWGRSVRALLLARLVRAHVQEEGGTPLPMHAVAAVPLIQDVAGLGQEHDVAQLLRGARGLRVVDDGGGGCRVEVEEEAGAAEERGGDGVLEEGEQWLRAMRWRLHTLRGCVESYERMKDEIWGVYDGEAEGGGRWEVGVALGAACDRVGWSYCCENKWKESISVFERALRMRLDTLGEQHPDTAVILHNMGAAYGCMGSHDTAIILYERALRIKKDTLGLHPLTASTIKCMGARYNNTGQYKKAIELYEQALRIYERTVGRMHRDTAGVLKEMSNSYYNLSELVKAEELGREAVAIREQTLGHYHKETEKMRELLSDIQKAKGE
jgi:tetratricopeptide (TPR) repeat protein